MNYDQLPAAIRKQVDAQLGSEPKARKDRRQPTESGLPLTHLRCGYVETRPSDGTLRRHDEACGFGRWEAFPSGLAALGASQTGDEGDA